MLPEAKRRRVHDEASLESAIKFSSTTKPPYHLFSNFYGGSELHFMAARFDHHALQSLLINDFATCSPCQFTKFFQQLYPSGKPSTYIRIASDGTRLPARGILGRLAGTAAVSQSATARKRMAVLRRLSGLAEGEPIATNTSQILADAGLDEASTHGEKISAIEKFNDRLMWLCLQRKFRKGHCSEDGIEFRALLLGTDKKRIREVTGRGGRWSARGEDDGVLGKMLVRLRSELRAEDADADADISRARAEAGRKGDET